MKQPDPVIKHKSSFSILLLRDDSKVVSFRLTPFWIKFLLFFFAVFSGLSGAAGYTAHYYWKKYNNLHRERSELAAILGENRRQLGRFAGIEKIKESTLPRSTAVGITTIAPANASQTEPAAPPPTSPGQHGAPQSGQPPDNGRLPAPETEQPFEPAAANDVAPPETHPGTPGSDSAGAVFLDPGANTVAGAASDPGSAPAVGNEHPALVDEAQIRHAGGSRFRLSFDLSNRNQQLTLNGRVHLAVATKTGSRHDITDVNRDSLRFVINRFKKVGTVFSLPEGLQSSDVETLYIIVTAEDLPDVAYSFSFPTL